MSKLLKTVLAVATIGGAVWALQPDPVTLHNLLPLGTGFSNSQGVDYGKIQVG